MTEPTVNEDQNPLTKPKFIISAVVVAIIVALGIILALLPKGGGTPTAEPSNSGSTTPSTCAKKRTRPRSTVIVTGIIDCPALVRLKIPRRACAVSISGQLPRLRLSVGPGGWREPRLYLAVETRIVARGKRTLVHSCDVGEANELRH